MAFDPEKEARFWQAMGRIERDGVTGAIENLRIGFGNIFSFSLLMPGGADLQGMLDIKRYLEDHSDHPMAEPQIRGSGLHS